MQAVMEAIDNAQCTSCIALKWDRKRANRRLVDAENLERMDYLAVLALANDVRAIWQEGLNKAISELQSFIAGKRSDISQYAAQLEKYRDAHKREMEKIESDFAKENNRANEIQHNPKLPDKVSFDPSLGCLGLIGFLIIGGCSAFATDSRKGELDHFAGWVGIFIGVCLLLPTVFHAIGSAIRENATSKAISAANNQAEEVRAGAQQKHRKLSVAAAVEFNNDENRISNLLAQTREQEAKAEAALRTLQNTEA
jgi:hypothetical protein